MASNKNHQAIKQELKNTVNDILSDLIQAKKKNGITQDKQANEIGITAGALSKYANGNSVPDATSIIKMAKYYNVSADYLLGLSSSKAPNINDRKMADELGLSDTSIKILKCQLEILCEGYTNNKNRVVDFILSTNILDIIDKYWQISLNEQEKMTLKNIENRFQTVIIDFAEEKSPEVRITERGHISDEENDMYNELIERQEKSYIALKKLEESIINNKKEYLQLIGNKNGKSEKN